jgi:predicted HicB family RNase H-like nuclease
MASYPKTFHFGTDEEGQARLEAYAQAARDHKSLNDWVKSVLDKAADFNADRFHKKLEHKRAA